MPSRTSRLSRRDVLRTTALTGAGFWIAGTSTAAESRSPNEKLNVAVIGIGGRGAGNLSGVSGENIVALCDLDEKRAGPSFAKFPNARKYQDFRKMLAELDKQIDAVVVSTPDHTHAPAAMMAMKMGKHCYCEKPLTHNVAETRALAEIAAKNKLATQLGTQIHAGANYRRVVEIVQSGVLGPIHEVYCWMGRSGKKNQGANRDRPTDTPPVPPGLDWDLWLGPAPYRPYHPCYCPGAWRGWWDFGNGTLGDFGCHLMDLPFWALGLRYPTTIEAEGTPVHPETVARSLMVRYEFPARGEQPPVKLTWCNGIDLPPLFEQQDMPKKTVGILFVGDKGMIMAHYGWRILLPEARFKDFQEPKPTIPDSIGHHQEWIVACKTGSPTTCNFDYSGALTEAVLLGNVAYRTGKKLQWDPKGLKAVNCPEADPYLHREYRQGWTL